MLLWDYLKMKLDGFLFKLWQTETLWGSWLFRLYGWRHLFRKCVNWNTFFIPEIIFGSGGGLSPLFLSIWSYRITVYMLFWANMTHQHLHLSLLLLAVFSGDEGVLHSLPVLSWSLLLPEGSLQPQLQCRHESPDSQPQHQPHAGKQVLANFSAWYGCLVCCNISLSLYSATRFFLSSLSLFSCVLWIRDKHRNVF